MRLSEFAINEAPIPDDWEKDPFTSGNFKLALKYARQKAKTIGTGSSRVAFEIMYQGRPTILKIAKNNAGISQNEAESDWIINKIAPNVTIPMIDYDNENYIWIHQEKANKINNEKFKSLVGISFSEFSNRVRKEILKPTAQQHDIFNSEPTEIYPSNAKSNNMIEEIVDLIQNTDHTKADMYALRNWGEYKGRPVIIDIGLTEWVYDYFYKRRNLNRQ